MERKELIAKLKEEDCFRFDNIGSDIDIPDDILIEKTLVHLDLPEIDALFLLFPYKKIKLVWLEHLVPLGEFMYCFNRFFAMYYFNVKDADKYIKTMARRYYNKNQ